MKIFATRGVAYALLSVLLTTAIAAAQTPASTPGDADFAAGNFDAAASAYAAALAASPDDPNAELGLGSIELYRNHIAPARAHLQHALALAPGSVIARARLDAIAKRTGGPGDYTIAFSASEARIPLVAIDPLPTFKAKIDGVPVVLLIDTGGPHLDLTESAVKRLGLATKSAGEGVFAGGLRAQIRSVHIDRFDVTGVAVRGIPGSVIPGASGFHGVDGAIGTAFLYHFLSTIDYAHRVLVLRPASDSPVFLASAAASGAIAIPIWLAADHFILARAHVNAAPDALYVIDTGGPGIGVELTKSSLAAAGITPDAAHPQSMRGGGGSTQVLPFTAASVTMGGLTQHDLPGIYAPSGGVDRLFPFALAGTISHEFFRHTAVTLDFASMTLVVAMYSESGVAGAVQRFVKE